MRIVLDNNFYSFDASLKTITLVVPYTGHSLGHILSIKDLTTNEVLYDVELQRTDPISISGSVITHTHGNTGQADTDKLQITVDVGGFANNPIHTEDLLTSISEGDVHITDVCIGASNSIGTGPFVIVSNCVAIQPSAGVQMEAVSTSTDDTVLGSGAQKLKLDYYTESPWEHKTEVVEMDGTTPVNTVATDIFRLNKVTVSKGSPAVGTITLKSTDAVTLYAQIDQYKTFFERAVFYVETGYQAVVTDIMIGCSTNGGVTWRLFKSDEDADTGEIVTRGRLSIRVSDAAEHMPLKVPIKLSNPNGKRIAIGLAVQGKVANQEGIGTIRGYCKVIGT